MGERSTAPRRTLSLTDPPVLAVAYCPKGRDPRMDLFSAISLVAPSSLTACIEFRSPWCLPTLWFAPTAADADALLAAGVTRGRVWTLEELRLVFATETCRADLRTLVQTKLAVDGDITAVLDVACPCPRGEPHSRFCRHSADYVARSERDKKRAALAPLQEIQGEIRVTVPW